MRTFEPRPRPTLVLPDDPGHGPLVSPTSWPEGDRAIAQYFWTSTEKDSDAWECDEAEVRRVINFGMKAQPVPHGTPTGHGHLTILCERVPVPIAEQMLRHRVQHQSPDGDSCAWVEWSPNVSKKSMRYVDGAPPAAYGGAADDSGFVAAPRIGDVFHVVLPTDWRMQEGRPGAYAYHPAPIDVGELATNLLLGTYRQSWETYCRLRALGIAPEQARFALCTGVMTRLYATASIRNWFNWLVQRDDAHTQAEHRQIAAQVDAIMRQIAPITHELWLSHGRRVI